MRHTWYVRFYDDEGYVAWKVYVGVYADAVDEVRRSVRRDGFECADVFVDSNRRFSCTVDRRGNVLFDGADSDMWRMYIDRP